ncbi:MAG: galactokinase family protein [Pirellulaceae bacterium]
MSEASPLFTIVLAAGKGRRMRNRYMHKVCFDIAGMPTIVRALDTFNRVGVTQNVVVVGDMAGQVVETVGERFSNVVFAYQAQALGTGHAARCGLQALTSAPDDARVLVVAGDKILDSAVITRLLQEFDATRADLQILVTPAELGGESAGRILLDDRGRPVGIAETADIRLRACREEMYDFLRETSHEQVAREALQRLIARHLHKPTTLQAVLDGKADQEPALEAGSTWVDRKSTLDVLAELPRGFTVCGGTLFITPHEALASTLRNESVYLVRKGALAYGLQHMGSDNAQGEQYLTDAIGAILAARTDDGLRFSAGYVSTRHGSDVMSYNNPEELLRITDYFHGRRQQSLAELQERLGTDTLRDVHEWLELFPAEGPMLPHVATALATNYGEDLELLRERHQAYRETLLRFQQAFGEGRQAIIVRSPGRINIMGRHIDYQGGRCNLMAVNQEVIMVVSPRDDDCIEVRNVRSTLFPDDSISLGRLVSQLNWDDWLSCVNCAELERHLRESAGRWSIYIEAAMLRMQMAFRERLLQGMDLVVHGNIPVAAGMSSSSALVVSAAEAAAALHGLEVTPSQFVNFCGEGEWFVGTRGGSADHAAMKYGAKGTINHVKFHDFELLQQIQFPDTHRMVVCNSFMQAKKAAGAKLAFNSRVASYALGVELVRMRFPQYAPLVRYVRDLDPDVLRVQPEKIYEILLTLPESMTAEQVRRIFRPHAAWQTLAPHFERVEPDRVYPVRGVMWFGISECARAKQAADCLAQGDLKELGHLMKISHDGERCFQVTDDLQAVPFSPDISDDRLHALIDDLISWETSRIARAQMYRQPGAYRCSIREIDALVDIACRTPGVLGAQIAGAGLGGCAMVLVESPAVDDLIERLERLFYTPLGLERGVNVCTPSAGSSLLRIET